MDSILLDTSFFIRLLNDEDVLHKNVLGFFEHFLNQEIRLKCSTICVAEYCVRGEIEELPLQNIEILPFNLNHAITAGKFANVCFSNKNVLNLSNRLIIPNDNKLFAQAHIEKDISHFATSDEEVIKVYDLLNHNSPLNFEIINIRNSLSDFLNLLPFTLD
jgi:hypothetical protein